MKKEKMFLIKYVDLENNHLEWKCFGEVNLRNTFDIMTKEKGFEIIAIFEELNLEDIIYMGY